MCALRRQRGFTLIEILVVIALLGVLAGLIVPRMGGSTQRRLALNAAEEFGTTVRTAAQLAVARHQHLAVEIDDHGYAVTLRSETDGQNQPVRASWLRPRRWPDQVHVLGIKMPDGANADSRKVELRPDGTSSGLALRLGVPEAFVSVAVDPVNAGVVVTEGDAASADNRQYDLGD